MDLRLLRGYCHSIEAMREVQEVGALVVRPSGRRDTCGSVVHLECHWISYTVGMWGLLVSPCDVSV